MRAPIDSIRLALDTPAGGPALSAPYDERKGWCYALALRAFVSRAPFGESTVTLVHGFPHRQTPEKPLYGHAWIELVDKLLIPDSFQGHGWPDTIEVRHVWDPILNQRFPLALYYRVGCIQREQTRRWTDPADVYWTLLEHGSIGNWASTEGLPETPLWSDS